MSFNFGSAGITSQSRRGRARADHESAWQPAHHSKDMQQNPDRDVTIHIAAH
jgi:hypothetical protein